jgi:response regulator of citrate/malate metabolism
VHRQFVERIPCFEVVGEATTGREARALVDRLAPDLVLLDIYLPDENGIELMRRLRAGGSPRVDVIAITSAKDVDVLRDAMQLGVVHYIVKPFTFATFRERLESYAAAQQRLADMQRAEQRDIDRLYGLLRTSGEASLPKGISPPTLTLVATLLRESEDAMSTAEVAPAPGSARESRGATSAFSPIPAPSTSRSATAPPDGPSTATAGRRRGCCPDGRTGHYAPSRNGG